MEKVDFINKSLLLRYEAFSKFATEVNQSNTLDDVGIAIASHVKFIFDAFVVRILFATSEEQFCLECFRGAYQCHSAQAGILKDQDLRYLENGLPCILTHQEIQANQAWQETGFAHSKVNHIFVLPLQYAAERKVLLQIGSKNEQPFSEVDFRFIRLFGEFLTTKLSQLFLGKKINAKTIALEDANKKLVLLHQQVKDLNSNLEGLVDQRTQSLIEAQKELNTLFYRTSHDFRRPLTSIAGLSNLIEKASDKEETQYLLQLQRRALDELHKMLNKLQTISLTDEVIVGKEELDLTSLLNAIKRKFSKSLEHTGVGFSYVVNVNEKIYIPDAILFAILENLVENAIQYRSMTDPYVKLVADCQNYHLILTIEDNAEGVPLQYQAKIFDMYYRASERASGNGLGLYIVKKLVDKLGGIVAVSSDGNQGSIFQVTIPLIEKVAC